MFSPLTFLRLEMRRFGELSEQRQVFVQEYCRLGDHVEAARRAGYSEKTLNNQACKLKRELSGEIESELRFNFVSHAPNALRILTELAEYSNSDSVRLQAARDLLDRAGYKAVERREEITQRPSTQEIESEIVRLVGREGADLLLQKKSLTDLMQEHRKDSGAVTELVN